MRTEKDNFNTEIQGLRAIAVGLVVLYHAHVPGLTGGYVGVDIFFVISGYLITLLLIKEFNHKEKIDLLRFYGRRARRLLPAAVVVLTVTVLLAWNLYSPLEFKSFSSSAIAASFYASNLWFTSLSTDYLAGATDTNPLLHTWSLAVEEQFYLFWPVIFLFLFKRFAKDTRIRNASIVMGAAIILSLIGCVVLTQLRQPWAFFNLPTRAWEFGVGALLAFWISNNLTVSKKWVTPMEWSGLALIVYASFSFDHQTVFPGINALIPVLGAALLILVNSAPAYSRQSLISRFLSTAPMQFFGNMSYSLYLWHWPVLVFLPLLLPMTVFQSGALGVVLSIFLGWITYRFIENPIRFSHYLKNSTKASFGLIGGFSLLVLFVIIGARQLSTIYLQSPDQKIYQTARKDVPIIYADKCHVDFFSTGLTECFYGRTGATKTIVIFGDSHAAQWFPAFEKISLEQNYQLLPMTKSSCPSVNIDIYSSALGRDYNECREWREKAFTRIEQLDPDLIVMSNSVWYPNLENTDRSEQWLDGLQQTIERLSKLNGNLILVRDIPKATFDPPTCLARAAWKKRSLHECTFPAAHAYEVGLDTKTREIIKPFDNARLLDMTPHICTGDPCETERNGVVIYRDSNHLTGAFSRSLAQKISAALSL